MIVIAWIIDVSSVSCMPQGCAIDHILQLTGQRMIVIMSCFALQILGTVRRHLKMYGTKVLTPRRTDPLACLGHPYV